MNIPEPPPAAHRLWVDKEALAHNWRALDAMSGDAATGAAVKADAYGLGVETCVPALRDAGAAAFFVAHWSEVPGVIAHVGPASVAVLHGPVTDAEAAFAIATGVRPVINSLDQARRWREAGGGACHLMVDTGINRLGIAPRDLAEAAVQALDIDVLMSHLACADEDSAMNARQLSAFRDASGKVEYRKLSLANSAGIALGPDYAFDLTRPGLSLYGGIARPELADTIRQVAHLEGALLQVKTIEAGERVGYNGEFVAPASMRVGTVAMGYADGFLRSRGPGCSFTHEGADLPLLGKVSMDMVVVDLAAAPYLREGDFVQVPFDLPHAARQSSVSQYELLTVLGQRLKR